MKKTRKILVTLLALVLVLGMAVPAFAVETKPGESGQVSFGVSGVYGTDGYVEVSDPNGILSGWSTVDGGGTLGGSVANNRWSRHSAEAGSATIAVNYTVSASAQPGSVATVNFNYRTANQDGEISAWMLASREIVVPDEQKPEETETPTQPTEAPVKPTEKPGTTGQGQLDYRELLKQIRDAEAKNEEDWTKESWENMLDALKDAKDLLWHAKTQDEIDECAKALEEAIAALKAPDGSKLEKALADGADLRDTDPIGNLWWQLFQEMEKGAKLLDSNDQEAMDAQADVINDLIEQIKKMIEDVTEGRDIIKEVEVIKEVPIEVEGEDCHIPMHHVWPWLFAASGAGNVGLIAALVGKKKKKDKDVPVAKYDIGDDA